jgi:apolipoprotein D and lipocalin family protein
MKYLVNLVLILLMFGCMNKTTPIKTHPNVDIKKFMGPWYVIAHIPTFIEKEAYNAVESYELDKNGNIQTTFTFNKGSLDGEVKKYHPVGYIIKGTENAEWKMQFIWPFKAQYKIAYIDPDYQYTIIARDKKDFVWLMARESKIDENNYKEFVKKIESIGYDISKIRKIPHNNQ